MNLYQTLALEIDGLSNSDAMPVIEAVEDQLIYSLGYVSEFSIDYMRERIAYYADNTDEFTEYVTKNRIKIHNNESDTVNMLSNLMSALYNQSRYFGNEEKTFAEVMVDHLEGKGGRTTYEFPSLSDSLPFKAFEDLYYVAYNEEKETVEYYKNLRADCTQTVTKTSLRKYMSSVLKLDQETIRDIQNYIKTGTDVLWATTREEIKRVYLEGPTSCMSKCVDYYHTGDIHPSEVYGTDDGSLALAYMELNGKIIARTMCNLKDQQFTTIYGHDAIRTALQDKGMEQEDDALVGCTLLRLETCGGDVVQPYIDGSNYNTYDHGDHLEVSDEYDGEGSADYSTGLRKDYEQAICYQCSDECEHDEYTDQDGDSFCSDCYFEYVCHECGTYDRHMTDGMCSNCYEPEDDDDNY